MNRKRSSKLQVLLPFHGHQRLEHWSDLIHAGEFNALVRELLELHYDPSYLRALGKHYTRLEQAQHLPLSNLSMETLMPMARMLLEQD